MSEAVAVAIAVALAVAVVANISVCMVGHEPTHYERKVPTIGEFCQRLESRLFKTYNMREAFKTIAMVIVMFPNNWCEVYYCISSIHLETGRWRYSPHPPPPPPPV